MRTNNRDNKAALSAGSGLALTRRLAEYALVWENLWPLALPIAGVTGLFLIVSWLGLWPLMIPALQIAILLIFAVGLLLGLYRLRGFRWPTQQQINTRVERSSALQHRPVTAQDDLRAEVKGSKDAFAQALWQEHKRRSAGQLSNLNSGIPVPSVARLDPFGARAMVGLGLFIAVMVGWGELGKRVGDAFQFHSATTFAEARVDAWVTAPAYTNKPPIFLNKLQLKSASVSVPEGSKLLVRVLDLPDASLTATRNDNTSIIERKQNERKDGQPKEKGRSFEVILEGATTVALRQSDSIVRQWAFVVTPDHDPTIEFVDKPTASSRSILEFSYRATDDYGLASASAKIVPLNTFASNARPLVTAPDLQIPTPSRRQVVSGFNGEEAPPTKTSHDLTSHPWAGAEVSIHLEAEDQTGQKAKSSATTLKLPERIFVKPLALAIVDERRILAMDAHKAPKVAEMLDVITTTHPDSFISNLSTYTALRVVYRTIKRAQNDDQLRDALELMWEIALAVEDGDLSLAEKRLRDAQERLARALEEGATDEEIAELMQDLRNAMNDFLTELADQMARNPQNQQAMPMDPNSQVLRQQDLNKLLEQIENLAKSGSRDAARQLLEEMQRMMNNLQAARPQPNQQQTDELSKQMNKLGEMMRKQQQLMDETFGMQRRQQEMQQNQGRQGQEGQQQQQNQNGQQGQQGQQQGGQPRPMTEEEFAEAMRELQQQQENLQKQMQELQQSLEGLGMQPNQQLGEAEGEMGGAQQNLGQSQPGDATGNQGRALQAMRQGAQQMMQQMQNQAGEQGQRGQRGQHGQQTRGDRDPLGRASRSNGPQLGDDVKVPNEVDAQRARDILDAIRRRLSDPSRPRLELDYLDRLLPTR